MPVAAEDCSEEELAPKELTSPACSSGRLELCEASEEEEEIDDWELSDDVIDEDDDSDEEDRLEKLSSFPMLEEEADVATLELEENELVSPAGRPAGWLEDEELTV